MLARMLVTLAVLGLSGCFGSEGLPSEPARVNLELSPTSDFREVYRATLETVPEGAVYRADYALGGRTGQQTMKLDRAQLLQVVSELTRAGALELGDGDCGDPEEQVLYTRFDVSCGDYHLRSRWRGLTDAQGRVAQVLLEAPFGAALREGLEAVRLRKAGL